MKRSGSHNRTALTTNRKDKHTMTQEEYEDREYDKLPVIYWKEILGANHPPYKRRPRIMHRTMNLHSLCWWIEKLFGLPRQSLRFVDGYGDMIDPNEHIERTVKMIYNSYRTDITIETKEATDACDF
jgi:hypothetical protein